MKDNLRQLVVSKQRKLNAEEVQAVKNMTLDVSWEIQSRLFALLMLQHPKAKVSKELQELFVGLEEALEVAVEKECER